MAEGRDFLRKRLSKELKEVRAAAEALLAANDNEVKEAFKRYTNAQRSYDQVLRKLKESGS